MDLRPADSTAVIRNLQVQLSDAALRIAVLETQLAQLMADAQTLLDDATGRRTPQPPDVPAQDPPGE